MVSVIIPCYNDGKYLHEAISSVLASTYDEYEIIVVDDGSTDSETIKVLKNIHIDKVKVITCGTNQGLSHARNYGISQALGKYILPLDADDKIASTYISKAVKVLEKNENIGIVYCEAELFGLKKGKWDLPEFKPAQMLVGNQIFSTAMFRKRDWQQTGGYCEDWKHGYEDYDFWLSILELGREVVRIPETLFFYRQKETSMITELINDKKRTQDITENIVKRHPKIYRQTIIQLNCELEKNKNDTLVIQEELKRAKQDYGFISNSISFKIGRVITAIPRHIKDLWKKQ